MKIAVNSVFNRSSFYTAAIVLALFAILPLSQRLVTSPLEEQVQLRRIDLAPPPPPPPPVRSENETGSLSQAGVNIESILPAVNLDPLPTGPGSNQAESLELGLAAVELEVQPQVEFDLEGAGFGTAGLDRPPIMLVRPTLISDYMRREGISQFSVVVMVKWLADGSLSFIAIEEIEYPDRELVPLIRDAVARIRYSRPTVDGEAVERFIRLPMTIHAE